MATEAELAKLEEDLGRLVAEVSKYEDLSTPEKLEGFIERILTQEGYVCRDGVWQPGNN